MNYGEQNQNTVVISYNGEYWNDGSGIHSSTDGKGDEIKQYLYTQGESYHYNKVFPMFDQPNLKARLNFQVNCPKKWEFITNTGLKHSTETETTKSLAFNETPLISTYLYGFVAGDYVEIDHGFEGFHNGLPARIFCRSVLKDYFKEKFNAF